MMLISKGILCDGMEDDGYPDGKKRELTEDEKSRIKELIQKYDSEDSDKPVSTLVVENADEDWTRSQVAGIMASMNR